MKVVTGSGLRLLPEWIESVSVVSFSRQRFSDYALHLLSLRVGFA